MTPGQRFDLNVVLSPYGLGSEDVAIFFAAIAAFMTIMTVGRIFIIRNVFAARVKLLQERRHALKNEMTGPRRRKRRDHAETIHFMRMVVNKIKLLKKAHNADLTAFLTSAGIRSKDAVYVFLFFRVCTPVALVVASLLYIAVAMGDEPPSWKWLIPLAAAYVGFRLPDFIIARKRKKRYIHIQRSLADSLDLLMICAEAGLSLSQGLERVSRELSHVYPEMADELSLTSIEMSFQPDRHKTLSNLAQRVQLPEVRGIVNVLVQTEKYGTPIAQALRTLSAEFRTQRMLRAEQKAARLPAVMTVPMILFILPTLFIVVIAPAAINLMNAN